MYAFRSYEKDIIAEVVELKLEKFINVQNKQERRNFSDRMERESSSLSVLERNRSTDDRNRWDSIKRGELKRETESLL